MFLNLSDVDWESYPRPEHDPHGTVTEALQALAAADDADTDEICSKVLYALGNNHAGTYYPVVIAALPVLGKILRAGPRAARRATLAILSDLACFIPEPEFETFVNSEGEVVSLQTAFRHGLEEILPVVGELVRSGDDEDRLLAGEVLADIRSSVEDE
jgi:hypothetical protein